jgi:multiple sugar transport system ATP-binding protein
MKWLTRVGIPEQAEKYPGQLSGGQQQRVALGRALVRDPQVFLLDEPLSNLDAKLRSYMRAELVELHARLGRTMVYVTHDQLEAMTMSSRIAILLAGELQQFAAPQEVYRAPANRFVASFIGTPSMNLIDGQLSREGEDWRFSAPAFAPLDLPPLVAEAGTGNACLGIRPEHVLLGEGDRSGQVQLVEQTGHENIVILALDDGTRLTGRTPAAELLRAGDTVNFRVDASEAHLFAPGENGRRLNAPR